MQRSACVQASATEVRAKDDTPGLAAAGPIHPRWSEWSIYRRWDGWRPSNSLRLRGKGSCPLNLLGRLPLRIWGTLRCHCPLIVSRLGRSQEVPEDGSLFNVSPVSPGFLMRPSDAAVQQPEAEFPLPLALDSFSDPKITFDHSSCHFRSIRNFFFFNFWTKWPPAAILDWTTMSVIELVRDIWMNNACVKFEERCLNPSKVIALTTKL